MRDFEFSSPSYAIFSKTCLAGRGVYDQSKGTLRPVERPLDTKFPKFQRGLQPVGRGIRTGRNTTGQNFLENQNKDPPRLLLAQTWKFSNEF